MQKEQKAATIEELRERFKAADSAIFVDFRGLRVGEVTELRSLLRKESANMLVVKNTLAGLAAQGTSFEPIGEHLQGPTAVVFSPEVRGSAKVLTDFAKTHDKLDIKFSILRGRIAEGREAAENLAKLPSREELLSQILGLINSPASTLLAQINAPGQQLASVLQAWIDKRKEAGEGQDAEAAASAEGQAAEAAASAEGQATEAAAGAEAKADEGAAAESGAA